MFSGHTHRQEWFAHPDVSVQPVKVDEGRLLLPKGGTVCAVTAGAVGQPRGGDGDRRASWVLWDFESRILEFRKIGYPVERAMQAILDAGLPEESAKRLLGE